MVHTTVVLTGSACVCVSVCMRVRVCVCAHTYKKQTYMHVKESNERGGVQQILNQPDNQGAMRAVPTVHGAVVMMAEWRVFSHTAER